MYNPTPNQTPSPKPQAADLLTLRLKSPCARSVEGSGPGYPPSMFANSNRSSGGVDFQQEQQQQIHRRYNTSATSSVFPPQQYSSKPLVKNTYTSILVPETITLSAHPDLRTPQLSNFGSCSVHRALGFCLRTLFGSAIEGLGFTP